MGVPYKIDRKIVEFIISQKQANPEMGCRNFVVLIKDRFGLDISKSTVNSVIKEAGLSRRIGRPRLATKFEVKKEEAKPQTLKEVVAKALPPKPEIVLPPEKKEEKPSKIEPEPPKQIPAPEPSKQPPAPEPSQPIILPEKITEPLQKPQVPIEVQAQKPKEPAPEEKPKKPQLEIKPVEPTKVREIKKEAPAVDISKLIQPISLREDEVLDAMGAFFLKAAEWEISKTSILGNLAREILPQIDPVDLEIKSDVLLYLPVFEVIKSDFLDAYQKKGLWTLANSREKIGSAKITEFFKELEQKQELFSKLYYECERDFKEALYFKFILQDGTIFYLDARVKSIWQEPAIPDNFSVSPQKAKNFIEDKFIQIFTKETQPIALFNAPSFRSFSPLVAEFVLALEDNPQKRIAEIDIISANNQELESYINIVAAKRLFVFGFWPWQEEAKEFSKGDIGVVRDFYFPELARQIYYTERKIEFPKQSENMLNVVFLKNSAFSSPRMGLVSNISSLAITTPDLIKLYLLSWPNFEDTYQDILSSSERLTYRGFVYPVFDEESKPKREQAYILPTPENDLNDNLTLLLNNLSTAAQRHFFPYGYRFADFTTMKQRFYSLPGRLKRKEKTLYVTLLPAKDYPYNNDLFYAVRRLNESNITDTFGHRLWFKVL